MKLFPRLLLITLLLIVLPFILGASPQPQDTPPDPADFVVYGVPWVLVGAVIIGLLKRYSGLSDEGSALISAGWAALGYLLIQNLPDLETALPWLPTYAPQVLWAILIFGAQLGLIPGTTAGRIYRALTGK